MDNISKEMFDKTEDAIKKVATNTLNLTVELQEIIVKMLEERAIEGEVSIKKMLNYSKRGGQLKNFKVSDSDYEQISNALKNYGVAFTAMNLDNQDSKLFIIKQKDEEKVSAILTEININKGLLTEINASDYLNYAKGQDLETIEKMTNVELELFRHYAKDVNLAFTCIADKDNNTVVFNAADSAKGDYCLKSTAWLLSSPDSDKIVKSINKDYENRKNVVDVVKNRDSHCFIIDKSKKNYIEVTPDGLSQFKNNKLVLSLSDKDDDFLSKAVKMLKEYDKPVVLSDEEFLKSQKDISEILKERTSVSLDTLISEMKTEVKTISALTAVELSELRNEMTNKNIDFSVSENSLDVELFDVSINAADYSKIRKIEKDIIQKNALVGKDKILYNSKFEDKGIAAMQYETKQKEVYIVDKNNPETIIFVSNQKMFSVNDAGEKTQMSSDKDFYVELSNMKDVAVFEKDDFSKILACKSEGNVEIEMSKSKSADLFIEKEAHEKRLFEKNIARDEQSGVLDSHTLDKSEHVRAHNAQKIYRDFQRERKDDKKISVLEENIKRNSEKVGNVSITTEEKTVKEEAR